MSKVHAFTALRVFDASTGTPGLGLCLLCLHRPDGGGAEQSEAEGVF